MLLSGPHVQTEYGLLLSTIGFVYGNFVWSGLRTLIVTVVFLERNSKDFHQYLVPSKEPKDPPIPTPLSKKQAADPLETADVTRTEQRRTDWRIVKQLMVHVWPRGGWKTRGVVSRC